MTKFYDRFQQLEHEASVALAAWENDHIRFARGFLTELKNQLGWPADQFASLQFKTNDIPDPGRASPAGYMGSEGYCFGAVVSFRPLYMQFRYRCLRSDGVFVVSSEAGAHPVDLKNPATLQPFLKEAEEAIQEHMLRHNLAVATGYKPD